MNSGGKSIIISEGPKAKQTRISITPEDVYSTIFSVVPWEIA